MELLRTGQIKKTVANNVHSSLRRIFLTENPRVFTIFGVNSEKSRRFFRNETIHKTVRANKNVTVRKLAEKYIKDLNIPKIELKEVEDTSDYYCFSYFHPTETYVGQGLIFINKSDERFFIYGSGDSDAKTDFIEKIIREKLTRETFPEFDIRKSYNIKINRVLRKMNLIEKLLELEFTYTIPEVVGSDIFRVSKPYNQKLFEERLSKLPCEFNNINAEKVCNTLSLNKEKKVVEFTISEYIDIKKENRIERATETDLETVW